MYRSGRVPYLFRMTRFAFLLFMCLGSGAMAQPFDIGNRTITFFDPERGRDIPTNVRYPATSAGNNTPIATGQFPVIVIGHGFTMETGAYANIWEFFVPRGYIVALPNTEVGFGPNHANFGLDIAFVAQALQEANEDDASPFFGGVAPSAALMGHSMGGGAATLGAVGNGNIRTLVTLAAAETDPSAVAAAANVEVPTLMFAGANDCVTPIQDHQGPIFGALAADCRAFVSITGGGHCYFANSNFNCNFGELFCSPSPTISRAQQQAVVNEFALPWLDHFLKEVDEAFLAVQDSILLSPRVVGDLICLSTSMEGAGRRPLSIAPNPAHDVLHVLGLGTEARISIRDMQGRVVLTGVLQNGRSSIDVSALSIGTYLLDVSLNGTSEIIPFLVVH